MINPHTGIDKKKIKVQQEGLGLSGEDFKLRGGALKKIAPSEGSR